MVDDDRFKWRWRPRRRRRRKGKEVNVALSSLSAKARKTGMRKASSLSFPNRIFLPLPLSLFAYLKIPCARTLKILLFRLLTCAKRGKFFGTAFSFPPSLGEIFPLGGETTRESYVAPHDVCALSPSPFWYAAAVIFGAKKLNSK